MNVVLDDESEVIVAFRDSDGNDVASTVLFRVTTDRASLVGTPVRGVTGDAGVQVFDGFPMLRIPQADDPNRWFVRLEVNGQPAKSFRVGDLLRVQDGVGVDENVWVVDSPGEVPLVARIGLRVSGPLGGDLDARFGIVSGLNWQPPTVPAGPHDQVKCPFTMDSRLRLDGQVLSEIVFGPGEDSRTVAVTDRQHSVNLRFDVPRLLWAAGDAVAVDGFGAELVSMSADEFLEKQPILWICTGVQSNVRVLLRGNVGQESDWVPTSRRGGRRPFDLRRFRDTVRQSKSPLLWFVAECDSGAASDVLGLRRSFEFDRFHLRHRNDEVVIEFVESVSMDGRVVRVWDALRPWAASIDFLIPDGHVGSDGIDFETAELAPGRYLAELTLEQTEPVYPGASAKNTRHFVVSGNQTRLAVPEAMAALADFPTRASIEAASTDSDAVEIASRALLSILALIDPPPGLDLDQSFQDEIKDHAVEALFDRSERFVEALIVRHQSGCISEQITQILTLHMLTHACDVPVSDGALTDLRYADLWEVSPVLAAAFDRPRSDSAMSRWQRHLGWVPSGAMPYPGHIFKGPILGAEADWLLEKHALIVSRGVRLLDPSGFEEATVRWLLSCVGDFSTVQTWRDRHLTLLRLSQTPWPAEASEAHKHLSETSNPVLRLPADLLAASLHLVRFTSDKTDSLARSALIEALGFAPRLVERQLTLALVHHLHAENTLLKADDYAS